jgi:hypothetical protein
LTTQGAAALAAAMSEGELERHVRILIRDLGLKGFHVWGLHARRASEGFPDWVIAGPGGVIFRELKRDGGRVSKAQKDWLVTLTRGGADANVWWPADLVSGRIARELAALAGATGVRVPPPGGER